MESSQQNTSDIAPFNINANETNFTVNNEQNTTSQCKTNQDTVSCNKTRKRACKEPTQQLVPTTNQEPVSINMNEEATTSIKTQEQSPIKISKENTTIYSTEKLVLNNITEECVSLNSTHETTSSNFTQEIDPIGSPKKPSLINKTEEYASIIPSQEHVYNNSTQEVVPKDSISQKPVNIKANPVSHNFVDQTQTPVSSHLKQIPSSQILIEDTSSFEPTSNIQKNTDSTLSDQILDQGSNNSSKQIIHKEPMTIKSNHNIETEVNSNKLIEPTTSNSNQFDNTIQDEKTSNVEDIEPVTKKRITRKTTKKEPVIIKPREPRKRRVVNKVNYCEQAEDEFIPEPENTEEKRPKRVKKSNNIVTESSGSSDKKGKDKKDITIDDKEKGPKYQKRTKVKEPKEKKSTKVEEPKRKKRTKADDNDDDVVVPKNRKRTKVNEPKKKTPGNRGRKKVVNEVDDGITTIEEVQETEKFEDSISNFFQNKSSFLTEINLKELIPQWLEALPEEDRQELAQLLPESEREMQEGKPITIKKGFGVGSNQLYEATSKWQDILALGGFELTNNDPKAEPTDTFKDENYERNWGDRLLRNQKKTKGRVRGRPKKIK